LTIYSHTRIVLFDSFSVEHAKWWEFFSRKLAAGNLRLFDVSDRKTVGQITGAAAKGIKYQMLASTLLDLYAQKMGLEYYVLYYNFNL
jgi:hypothetical protein